MRGHGVGGLPDELAHLHQPLPDRFEILLVQEQVIAIRPALLTDVGRHPCFGFERLLHVERGLALGFEQCQLVGQRVRRGCFPGGLPECGLPTVSGAVLQHQEIPDVLVFLRREAVVLARQQGAATAAWKQARQALCAALHQLQQADLQGFEAARGPAQRYAVALPERVASPAGERPRSHRTGFTAWQHPKQEVGRLVWSQAVLGEYELVDDPVLQRYLPAPAGILRHDYGAGRGIAGRWAGQRHRPVRGQPV